MKRKRVRIIVFDNLVQQHSNGVLGMKQKVKVCLTKDQEQKLKEVALRAQQAGAAFISRFK